MRQIQLGILGLGNMGAAHAANILSGKCPELVITAAADTDPGRLEWARQELGSEAALYDNADALIQSGVAEALLICVPHYDHPRYAVAALKQGLHVMTEKPAGVYSRQVREMNAAAAESDRVFGIMYNQRTDHIFRKMREIVQSGDFGAIRRTSWIITNWFRSQAYYDSGTWRATWRGEGGGVLLNQCPHNLDLWQWICGMPVKVSARLHYGKWHNIEVEDDVSAYVEYENGATGTFVTTTGDAPGTNRFEITMERGKLLAEDGKLTLWELAQGVTEYSHTTKEIWHGPAFTVAEVPTDGKSEQHVGVMNAFAAAILRGEPLIAGGEEGLNGLMISNAMHLSSWLQKDIALPFDDDLYYEELAKRVSASQQKTGGGGEKPGSNNEEKFQSHWQVRW